MAANLLFNQTSYNQAIDPLVLIAVRNIKRSLAKIQQLQSNRRPPETESRATA
jgi:hypothetical protein